MSISHQHYPLLEAARRGDAAALDHLLRICQPDVRRYAFRHCLVSDVDDAVQETLLIVAHRLASLRGRGGILRLVVPDRAARMPPTGASPVSVRSLR